MIFLTRQSNLFSFGLTIFTFGVTYFLHSLGIINASTGTYVSLFAIILGIDLMFEAIRSRNSPIGKKKKFKIRIKDNSDRMKMEIDNHPQGIADSSNSKTS